MAADGIRTSTEPLPPDPAPPANGARNDDSLYPDETEVLPYDDWD